MNTNLNVWVDGSCLGNPGPGGWGVFIPSQNGLPEVCIQGSDKDTTNNRMELTAILGGIEACPEDVDITIYSDSKWSINTLTGKYRSVKNPDLVSQIRVAIRTRIGTVDFVHVFGHSVDGNNNKVDSLARSAAKAAKASL